MKTYLVWARYSGKVLIRVMALNETDAIRKIDDCQEDMLEVDEPSKVEPDYKTIMEVK